TRKERYHLPYLIQLSPRPPLHALIGSQSVRFIPHPGRVHSHLQPLERLHGRVLQESRGRTTSSLGA
ncbi:hypothetical protein BC826DRAFT_1047233, partial [Russula brevipes]